MKTEETPTAYTITPAVAVDIIKRLAEQLSKAAFAGDDMCQYERSKDDTAEGKRIRYDCNWELKMAEPVATPQGKAALTLHVAFTMAAPVIDSEAGRYGQAQIDIREAHIVETDETRIRNIGAANLYLAALCAGQPPLFP